MPVAAWRDAMAHCTYQLLSYLLGPLRFPDIGERTSQLTALHLATTASPLQDTSTAEPPSGS